MTQQIIFIKQALVASLIAVVLAATIFVLYEPQLLRAQSSSDSVNVTLTVTGGISISSGADIAMSPNIGLAVSTSTGETSWTVITNDPNGYTLAVRATGTPAMQATTSLDTIDDFYEAVAGTPNAWSISSTSAEFGYSAYGTDVSTGEYGTDGACETSPLVSANRLYEGFSTVDNTIATRAATTSDSGVTTTMCVAVEQNGGYQIPSGNYKAEIIATATVI